MYLRQCLQAYKIAKSSRSYAEYLDSVSLSLLLKYATTLRY
jgi:hypothetical protein